MDFFTSYDKLLKENKINDARNLLEDSLEHAIKNNNTALIIQILNEAIGFYRDLSEFDTSVKYANALLNLIKKMKLDYKDEATCLINIANAFRAGGLLEASAEIFKEAKSLFDLNINDSNLLAALYNNWALLYEEKNEFKEAISLLKQALALVNDEIKIASTHVNLGMCYLKLNELALAECEIEISKTIFGKNKNDFHYSGFLALKAKYYNLIKEDRKAINYYEEALANLLKTVGQNTYYHELKDELFKLYDKHNIARHIKGLELSESFFNENKALLFKKIPSNAIEYITIGLFGFGSECYGVDDEISEDHDFDQGFIILVEDSVPLIDFLKIKQAYECLPKLYKRFCLLNQTKHGVHYMKEYLNYLGVNDIKNISDESKALLLNGKLFYQGFASTFANLRYDIRKNSNYDFLIDLSLKALEINKYIPYNLKRSLDRGDLYTFKSLKNNLVNHLIEFYYIYHKMYLPHDKLRLKLMDNNSIIKKWIYYILDHDDISKLYEEISAKIIETLHNFNVIKRINTLYIEDYKEEITSFIKEWNIKRKLTNEIVEIEYKMFKSLKNIGGEASCQRNYPYFKLMREAQYLTFNINLLESYLEDLHEALNNNYNLLEIKYGFMEETLDPNHFKEISSRLPQLTKFQKEVIASISDVVLEMKNLFDKTPHAKMRDNDSSYDTYNNASYETYLKGELASYSEKTLYLYARMLQELSQNNQNIVSLTAFYTYFLRCYESVI